MQGSLDEFTLAQLLQLFAVAEKSGTVTVETSDRRSRLLVELDRITGIGLPEFDVRAALLNCELLSATTRSALQSVVPRLDTPGLSLVISNLVEPARWDAFVERRFEQDVYPFLSTEDGRFTITVEHPPPAAVRVSVPIQQVILDSSRTEAETEALRGEGYQLSSSWRRAPINVISSGHEFGAVSWLVWITVEKPATIGDVARRLGIPDLAAMTTVRQLDRRGLLQRCP